MVMPPFASEELGLAGVFVEFGDDVIRQGFARTVEPDISVLGRRKATGALPCQRLDGDFVGQ